MTVTDDPKKKLNKIEGRLQEFADLPTMWKIREQQERFRDLVEPSAIRELREQQERIQDLMEPPAIRAIREQQERFQDLVEPSAIRALREQQERIQDLVDPSVIRTIREQQECFQDLVEPSVIRELRDQQERLQDLVDPPVLRAVREQQEAMKDLIESWKLPSLSALDSVRLTAAFSLGLPTIEAALRGACLEEQAKSVEFASSGIEKLLSGISAADLQNSRNLLNAGVEYFSSPFDSGRSGIVADIPSEIFRTLDVDAMLGGSTESNVETEREEVNERTSDILEVKLAGVNSELVELLAGARTAAYSNNPDRIRHVCVSLRELLGHALRQLAPDTAIRQWTQNPDHYHDARPTRRARLEYLYRGVHEPALSKLITVDIRAALELFDTLSSATHKTKFAESQGAALVLLSRAEGVLLLLLRLTSDSDDFV